MAKTAKVIKNENRWYKLDNAAKIYPAISSSKRRSVFRIAVRLKNDIQPQLLQEALNLTLPRFPTFAVKMKKGVFWYYFDHNPGSPVVVEETSPPCDAIDTRETQGFLFRVLYYKKRISLEVFHALTDGTGALTFLKSLTFQYLSLAIGEMLPDENILDCTVPPSLAEVEDSFSEYNDPEITETRAESKAYQITGTRMPSESTRIIHGTIPLQSFIRLVKESSATVSGYIASLMVYSIYAIRLEKRKCPLPVKVSIPVNLRNIFPSGTLRNFSSYINPGIHFSKREYTFEEVLEQITAQMKEELQSSRLIGKFSANVKAEKNVFLRIAPLFIKDIVLKTAFSMYGESRYSCAFSNLGVVQTAASMEPHIGKFEFVMGNPVLNMVNCGVCSFQDQLVITFTSVMQETDLERFFFRFLAEKGLEITIETNEGGS